MSIVDDVKEKTDDIRTKVYGREVRSSIADGIDEIAEVVESAVDNQIDKFDAFMTERRYANSDTGDYFIYDGGIYTTGPNKGTRVINEADYKYGVTWYIRINKPTLIKIVDNTDIPDLTNCHFLINTVWGYNYNGSVYTPESDPILEGGLWRDGTLVIYPITGRTHFCVTFKLSNPDPDIVFSSDKLKPLLSTKFRLFEAYSDNDAIGDNIAKECYADLEWIDDGWWTGTGTKLEKDINDNILHRSQLLPIRGGHDYYLSHQIIGSPVLGAYFDKDGNWSSALLDSNTTAYGADYTGANGYIPDQAALNEPDLTWYPTTSFLTFRKFTAPRGASYISINLPNKSAHSSQKIMLASEPIYLMQGTGNFIIKNDDILYQKYKHKNLCIIGPSTVMINRWTRTGAFPDFPTVDSYIAGFQEYLKLWFNAVVGYGYSGAGYYRGGNDPKDHCSIYTHINGGEETIVYDGTTYSYSLLPKDLTPFDVFIILPSGNKFPSTDELIGNIDIPSTNTYLGAIRAIYDNIMAQVPTAEVYFGLFGRGLTEDSAAFNEQRKTIDDAIIAFAEDKHQSVLGGDIRNGNGINSDNWYNDGTKNIEKWYSYDGTHQNNLGNQRRGLNYRKAILGF